MIPTPRIMRHYNGKLPHTGRSRALLMTIISGLADSTKQYKQTQRQLADMLDVSKTTVNRYLHDLIGAGIITYWQECRTCKILNTPGSVCSHCGNKLQDSIGVIEVIDWVQDPNADVRDAETRPIRMAAEEIGQQIHRKLMAYTETVDVRIEKLESLVATLIRHSVPVVLPFAAGGAPELTDEEIDQAIIEEAEMDPELFLDQEKRTTNTNVLDRNLKSLTETCPSATVPERSEGTASKQTNVEHSNFRDVPGDLSKVTNTSSLLDNLIRDVPPGTREQQFYRAAQLLEQRLEAQETKWARWKRDRESGFDMEKPKAPNSVQTKARFTTDVIRTMYPGTKIDIKCVINEIKNRGFLRYIEEQVDFYNPELAKKVNAVWIPRVVGRS